MALRPVESTAPKASPLKLFRTVFWSFFGVRRRTDNQADLAGITPLQVVGAGVVGAAIFVKALVLLVNFITGRAGNGTEVH